MPLDLVGKEEPAQQLYMALRDLQLRRCS